MTMLLQINRLLLTCNGAHPITSPWIYFSHFYWLSWFNLHPTIVFISSRTAIGVNTYAAQVAHLLCELWVVCCPQCGSSSAALNRLGLVQLELTQTGCVLLKLASSGSNWFTLVLPQLEMWHITVLIEWYICSHAQYYIFFLFSKAA